MYLKKAVIFLTKLKWPPNKLYFILIALFEDEFVIRLLI